MSVGQRHPLSDPMTRAGYSADSMRVIAFAALAGTREPDDQRMLVAELAALGRRLRALPLRDPELRRAALRLAAAVE